ncbi:hypothetical protein RFI_13720 [Reticulomyxa filosa]|uniref:Uncharacterized protein n=1 Tax=Reticulomyxa filosa TaxID=46433 RepID=X6NBU1_RETFI|nr:hypothetical protein RFI_13720 [Reticulomyxa filosa]|eukprot:ETO23461.1 hypothetical protein RFI_13720 [Reticulomyxa filosa]
MSTDILTKFPETEKYIVDMMDAKVVSEVNQEIGMLPFQLPFNEAAAMRLVRREICICFIASLFPLEKGRKGIQQKKKKKKKGMGVVQQLTSEETKSYMGNEKGMVGRRIVFVEMELNRISEIDCTEEQFRSRFRYYLTWLATFEEVQSYDKWKKEKSNSYINSTAFLDNDFRQDSDQWKPSWVPYLEFINAIDIIHYKQKSFVPSIPTIFYSLPLSLSSFSVKDGPLCMFLGFFLPFVFFFFFYFLFFKKAPFLLKRGDIVNNNGSKFAWDIPKNVIGFDPSRGHWIRVQFEADVVFYRKFEMQNFPFDV